ncbi:hypothetical protein R1flu_015177 [Riccia fluitans]|uniref:Uncharacterized protein n=1 Tax=Riccia fluitans TaxID=41844 RepID=A0ABD1YI69_9MARC
MFTANGTSHRKRTSSSSKHGVSRTSGRNDSSRIIEEGLASRVEPNYGNKLLSLRAALNEKELQLVELREQHISVVNRAAIARKNWEDALKSKDQVIVQLQKALHVKKCELDRQERVNEENVQRLLQQREVQETTELEQKERKISHLEAKNTQFVQELVDQQKTITKLKKQIEDRERHCASHLHKIDLINGRVQDLKAALQKKEEVVENQQKYCQEVKALLWKRDSVIGQLQLAEQQLQSSLARQEADYEALECAKQKLEEEKEAAEKNLTELRQSIDNRDEESLHIKCEKSLKEKESFLRKQRRQIQEIGRCLESAEDALDAKRRDYQQLLEENRRLVEKYDSLKQDFEVARQRQHQLESSLEAVQERLVNAERVMSEAEQAANAPSPKRSFAMDAIHEHLMDDFSELERQSNPSVVSFKFPVNLDSVLLPDSDICKTQVDANAVEQENNRRNFQGEHLTKTFVYHEGSRSPAVPSTRNFSSSAGRANKEQGYKFQTMRGPPAPELPNALPNKQHPHRTDQRFQGLPNSRRFYQPAQATSNFYQQADDTVKKTQRKAWSLADGTSRHISPTGAIDNGRLTENVVSEVRSHSSECSGRSSPSKQEMESSSSSEMQPEVDEERSPTPGETFQNWSICSQKKTPTYNYISRQRRSSHMRRSPSSTEDLRIPSPVERRNAISVNVNDSKAVAQPLNGRSTLRQFSQYEGEMGCSNDNNRRRPSPSLRGSKGRESPASSAAENGKISYSQSGRESKGRVEHQEVHESVAAKNVTSHGTGRQPSMATKLQASSMTTRNKDSLRPTTPPAEQSEESSETALKSLQDEVMKRERGWRRTEANMRAALCQRLAELNGLNQSIRGEVMVEMVERARFESKRPIQRRKTFHAGLCRESGQPAADSVHLEQKHELMIALCSTRPSLQLSVNSQGGQSYTSNHGA